MNNSLNMLDNKKRGYLYGMITPLFFIVKNDKVWYYSISKEKDSHKKFGRSSGSQIAKKIIITTVINYSVRL